jgi:predicted helicase
LKRQDFGIDIICQHQGKFIAVQCKYKKHVSIKKNVLTWKQLSTFYALCMRSGPYEKYIVMTTCDYTRHMGKKTSKDISLCLKTFQNITKEEWTTMCQLDGNVIEQEKTVAKTPEELREARLKYYLNNNVQS